MEKQISHIYIYTGITKLVIVALLRSMEGKNMSLTCICILGKADESKCESILTRLEEFSIKVEDGRNRSKYFSRSLKLAPSLHREYALNKAK